MKESYDFSVISLHFFVKWLYFKNNNGQTSAAVTAPFVGWFSRPLVVKLQSNSSQIADES